MSTTSRGLRPFSPQSFGRYTLLTHLATGGMGAVYLARLSGAEGFQKLVVIKKILPQLAQEPAFVERFLDEARMVVQLQHGSIAQVLDMDSEAGEYYIAMEFVDGKDLRKVAARARELKRPIPPALALFVMVRVLDALAYAHRKKDEQGRELNLVHRDISPQNVLISYEGEVKVIDFGLAKSAQTLGRTLPHMVLGKFFYMAPEVARHAPADRRSDLYAAGICLWELLAGKNPFDDIKPHDILRVAANPEIPPIRALRPELPASLEQALQKALAVDPAQRFQSAEEMRGRLTAAMLEVDPAAGPEALAAVLRGLFAAEHESERRALSTLSRWRAEASEVPAAGPGFAVPPPGPTELLATPPQPLPLSRQATELVPPGFLPGEPEPPTVPVPILRPAPTGPGRRPTPPQPTPAMGRLSVPAPGPASDGSVTIPGGPALEAPRARAATLPSSSPGSREDATEPVAVKGKAPTSAPAPASESTVFVSAQFLSDAAQGANAPPVLSRHPTSASAAKAPLARRPSSAAVEAAKPAQRLGARPEGEARRRAPPGGPLPEANPALSEPKRQLFYLGAAVGLAAIAVSGASLLLRPSGPGTELPRVTPPALGQDTREQPPQALVEEREGAAAPSLASAERAPPAEVAAPVDSELPTPAAAAAAAAAAATASQAGHEPDGKAQGQPDRQPGLRRRLKALHDSIERDLKELSARKKCEDIGYTCVSWESIEKQYGAKLGSASEKNLKDLERLLEQSRTALDEAMAGGAGAPR